MNKRYKYDGWGAYKDTKTNELIGIDEVSVFVELLNKQEDCIEMQNDKIKELNKALQFACEELDNAKDMLRDCNKNEWASLINASADYFITKSKE